MHMYRFEKHCFKKSELEFLDLQSTRSKEEVTATDTPPSLCIQIKHLERRGRGQFQVQWCGPLISGAAADDNDGTEGWLSIL